MFSEGSKKNIGIKRVKIFLPFEFITHNYDLNRIRMDLFLKIHWKLGIYYFDGLKSWHSIHRFI